MFNRIAYVLTTICILSLPSDHLSIAGAADVIWPGWRGPQRDGRAVDFQTPQQWPEQPRRLWQAKVGTGYGSPLVAGNRVYQHARQGEEEVVVCLDLRSGRQVWRQSYPVPFKMGGGGERHGKGPKSSPALGDGRVFTMSITGVLTAWDMDTGNQLWQRDYSSRFPKGYPYWGMSTSPIVDANRVIVHFGADDHGMLAALDTATGEEIWTQGKDGPDYSSPILVEIHGVRQVVEWNQRALAGVESSSGRLLWEYPYPHIGNNQNMPTPVFHRGRVLLGGENRGILSLEPQLDDGVWSVKERWHQQEVALDMSSAVVCDDLLYGFSHYDSGRIFCLDPETGEIKWKGPGRTGQNVMFLSLPEHVVALINNGRLQILRADGDSMKEAASYRVSDSETWAPPVLLDNRILVKDKDTLTMWAIGEVTEP